MSQFVARVLDQLSLSAWLPSAALVGTSVFLVQVRSSGGSPTDALTKIGNFDLTSVVLLVLAVVIGTIITQAFEFEAIRWLEGYWGTFLPLCWAASLGCRWHTWRRNRHDLRRRRLRERALSRTRSKITGHFGALAFAALEARVLGTAPPPDVRQDDIELAETIPWREDSSPHLVRQIDDLTVKLRGWPLADHRVLPTRLGNILRAHEDRAVAGSSENVEGFVLRRFASLPPALQHEHDQYRTRLDLYCSMVLVSLICGAAGLALLWSYGWTHRLAVAACAFGACLLSRRGAISAASGYGVVLESIAAGIADG